MSVLTTPDRRRRRRQESIDEVLDVATTIMAEHGVGGLSLGEIARRMGIRPPSLYVYFPSKKALYDGLFARAAADVLATLEAAHPRLLTPERPLEEIFQEAGELFVRWCMSHQAYAQLLFWRPVPGYEPSPEAYAPAVAMLELGGRLMSDLSERGQLRPDIDPGDALRDWTVLMSGVVTQQMANAPEEPVDSGRFTGALPSLVTMFARHYGA